MTVDPTEASVYDVLTLHVPLRIALGCRPLAARRTDLRFSQAPVRIVPLSSLLPAVPDCKRMELTVTLLGADGG